MPGKKKEDPAVIHFDVLDIFDKEEKTKHYAIPINDITGVDSRRFRIETGMTLLQAGAKALSGAVDLEALAALIWLAEHDDKPDWGYEKILESLTYRHVLDAEDEDAEEAAENPTEG